MKTKAYRLPFIAAFGIIHSATAADLIVEGNKIMLGDQPLIISNEVNNITNQPEVLFDQENYYPINWTWGVTPYPETNPDIFYTQMNLDEEHRLNLYSPTNGSSSMGPNIILDPGDVSYGRHPKILIDGNTVLSTGNLSQYLTPLLENGYVKSSHLGGFVDTGNFSPETSTPPVEGAGVRLMWYPGKGAFRTGRATGTQWNKASIGNFSNAMGLNTIASGHFSFATGTTTTASGESSVAMGSTNIASGQGAVAMGINSVASGDWAIAMGNGAQATSPSAIVIGGSIATTSASVAIGTNNKSTGFGSMSIGRWNESLGSGSLAMGFAAIASGDNSVGVGNNADARGTNSVAMGPARASSFRSVAVGSFNVGGGNATAWVATDPIFEVGNGEINARSNAVTVLKNGNMSVSGNLSIGGSITGNLNVQGVITCAPGGNIPMYGD